MRLLYASFEAMSPGRAADTHVSGVVSGLTQCGWRVELIAAQEGRSRRHDLARQLWRYVRVNFRAILALRHNDAVYVRSHFAAWPLAQFARWMGLPIFHEVNGVPDDLGITYPAMGRLMSTIRLLYRSQFRRATHLFAVTDGLARYMAVFAGHGRISVVPNGVDSELFCAADVQRPAKAPEGAYALFYGDLARWHGLDLMLAAAREPAWPTDLRLLVIGRGSAAASLDIPPDLGGRVVWLDRMLQSELLPFITHARMGLAPITDPGGRSLTGVMPLKLIEMMACGLPVIVTDLPGQADLVSKNDCGAVVPIDDPRAMAIAVAELARSERVPEMGARGRASVERSFTWAVIGKQIHVVIKKALAARCQR
jgi:glycosyltransferase involved in cell wall biosynthesis